MSNDEMKNTPFEVFLDPIEGQQTEDNKLKLLEKAGRYKIGPPERPLIKHDNGFLDKYPRREPTAADYAHLVDWKARAYAHEMLCTGEKAKNRDVCKSHDQSDAAAAYNHFLNGKGKPRRIDYERYITGDPSGEPVIRNIIDDFRIDVKRLSINRQKFSVTSDEYSIGGKDKIAPYPARVNWQRTLGAHSIWVSADVEVSATPKGQLLFVANVVFHLEDMYNFNPGKADESSNIPDEANGRFEVTGLAHQYLNFGEIRRHVEWEERPPGITRITKA